MPELPEVETVRDGLARHVLGHQVTGVEVFREYSVRRHEGGPHDFSARLSGRVMRGWARRGKFLWCEFDEPGEVLVAHLGMSGQLLIKEAQDAEPRHPHVRVRLWTHTADGREGVVDFVDQRTFGYLALSPTVATADARPGGRGSERAVVPSLAEHIARDLLDPVLAVGSVQWEALLDRCVGSKVAVKRLLLDQSVMSGVGNIYADEGLWRARIHGESAANAVTCTAWRRLLTHLGEVMGEALVQGGTSFDDLYVNVNGQSGYFDRSLNVYGREGEPCRRCATPIRRSAFMNRSSFWCPRCQRKRSLRTG